MGDDSKVVPSSWEKFVHYLCKQYLLPGNKQSGYILEFLWDYGWVSCIQSFYENWNGGHVWCFSHVSWVFCPYFTCYMHSVGWKGWEAELDTVQYRTRFNFLSKILKNNQSCDRKERTAGIMPLLVWLHDACLNHCLMNRPWEAREVNDVWGL